MGSFFTPLSIPCLTMLFRFSVIVFQSLCIISTANAAEWDWYPRESLTTEQTATLNQYCRGDFVDAWQPTSDENTRLSADLIYRDQSGTLFLEGGAEIIQPFQSLTADTIEGKQDEYYHAQGNVELRQQSQLIQSGEGFVSSPNSQTDT